MPKCKDCIHFLRVLLSVGDCNRWGISALSNSPACEVFVAKPHKPKWWQKVLCVLIILGIYVLLLWMENVPTEDLRFALLAVPCALVAGLWIRRVREGMR